jgi:hypothetical protein
MMGEEKNNRDKWLHIRLTSSEFKKITAGFSRSTKRKLSEYSRSILLEKPITVYTRNQSFDDFVAEMILLRFELKAIGKNFNQLVKKIHMAGTDHEVKTLALQTEKSQQDFIKKMEEINHRISQIADKWSRE